MLFTYKNKSSAHVLDSVSGVAIFITINEQLQTALTHTSRPYCVLTATQDAAQSPWTQQGRSEVVARNPRTHNVADRRRIF